MDIFLCYYRPNPVPIEKVLKKVRLSEDTTREKEKAYDDAFDRYDIQRQIRASIVSLPGDLQLPQSIQVSRKRFWFLTKLLLSSFYLSHIQSLLSLSLHSSSLTSWKKSNDSPVHSLKLFEIYKYADRLDVILMIIGTIAGKAILFSSLFFQQ